MTPQPAALTNLQLELLKLFANNVEEQDLLAIRSMIGLYFAEKATTAMNEFIAEKGMTAQQIANWAYEHWRHQSGS